MRLLFTFLSCLILSCVSVRSLAACTPNAGALSGPVIVCAGSSITLSSTVSGGTWSSSDPSVAVTGVAGDVTGVSGGTAIITYTVVDTCGTATVSQVVTVNPTTAGTLTGPANVCVGNAIILSPSVAGGTWLSSNTGIATVTGGVVVGWTPGTVNITYTIANSCGVFSTSATVTSIGPTAGVIMGPGSVCQGSSITLSSTVPGGTWVSQFPSTASVNASSGVVTGNTGGGTVISYTANNSCGLATVTTNVLVDPLPFAGSLVGATTVCNGSSTTLLPTVPGGTWVSTTPSVATAIGGVILGISPDTTTIIYTVINSCGPASVSTVVTVNPAAIAGPVSGPTGVCRGSNITLTGVTPGGTWSSSAPWVATVGTSGVVHGVAYGTAVIFYAVNNSCGSSTAIQLVYVDTPVTAGSISIIGTGAQPICMGTTLTFGNAVAGGTWYLGTTSIATLTTPPGGTAVVGGVSPGTTTLYYSIINGCGGSVVGLPITVSGMPNVGAVGTPSAICAGSSVAMTTTGAGGTWVSGNASVASVNAATGLVTGNAPGTASIMYIASNTCGADTSSANVTVNAAPIAGIITGLDDTVCIGRTITFTPGAPAGVWEVSDTTKASVDADGVVTGKREGVFTLKYTINNGCGTATASAPGIVVFNCTLETPFIAGDAAISIYPNPATSNITVSGDAGIEAVTVSDMLGHTVWQGTGNRREMTVDMSKLTPGIYTIRVNNTHVYRVVKE